MVTNGAFFHEVAGTKYPLEIASLLQLIIFLADRDIKKRKW